MPLTNNLVSNFAKTTHDNINTSKETIAYGWLGVEDNQYYVKINGSDIKTPVSVTTNIDMNQPVMVMIKNHKAIIIGNKHATTNETKTNNNIVNDTSASLSIESMDDVDINKIFEDHPLI